MDTLDRFILNELSFQGRVSFTELADKYGVSLSTVKNRVEALVEEGVILNFVAQLPLRVMKASIAIISLDIRADTKVEDLIGLGEHPFITALGVGYELEGFAIAIYRTNDELTQTIDHLQSSEFVESAQAFPIVGPPAPIDSSQTKSIDSLKKLDWKILQSLQWDGRKTLGEIASDVGASVPTVRKRLAFMRKHNLIEETIHINPAATDKRLVVMFVLHSPVVVQMEYFQLDRLLREWFPETYWLGFRMADRPEIMLAFVIGSAKDASQIRSELSSLSESTEIVHQMIVPQWIYFPDFRHYLVDERAS